MRSSAKFVQKLAGTAEPTARLTELANLSYNFVHCFQCAHVHNF